MITIFIILVYLFNIVTRIIIISNKILLYIIYMYLTRLKKKKIKMMTFKCNALTNTDKEEHEEKEGEVFI